MNIKFIFLFVVTISISVFVFIDPIPQQQNYYNFSDKNNYFGINNFFNVISNIPFIIIGIFGLVYHFKNKLIHENYSITPTYAIFFLGVLLTGFGSSWFHLNPNDETLVWDRLPMTIGFMALITGLLSEYLYPEFQKQWLYPLLVLGFISVIYWYVTEQNGQGDLRLYALVQFLPLLVIPLIMLTNKAHFTRSGDLIAVVGFYLLAKLAEHFDQEIHQLLGIISGHSLKHLLAAIATYYVLRMLLLRKLIQKP